MLVDPGVLADAGVEMGVVAWGDAIFCVSTGGVVELGVGAPHAASRRIRKNCSAHAVNLKINLNIMAK